jgi:competence ComEA-like helix-hairpin-helix protein
MRNLLLAIAPLLLFVSVQAQDLPDGPNKQLFSDTCGGCHGADVVIGQTGTKERWSDTVDQMRARGAAGSDADFEKIIAYLSKYFGPAVSINKEAAKDLATDLDITAAEAAAIVKYRTDKGNFKEWADLAKVTGLDVKKIEPLKGRIVFN